MIDRTEFSVGGQGVGDTRESGAEGVREAGEEKGGRWEV